MREGEIQVGDRKLAYCSVGQPTGPLVLHNHGGPSSRLEANIFSSHVEALRLHMVCVDRPGIGMSSRQPNRTFAGWADDLTAVADHFRADRFAVTGWSEGGPWALAAAAYIDPDRLVHVANIAGGCYGALGTNWAAQYLSTQDALGGRLALHFRPGFRLMYGALGLTAKRLGPLYRRAIINAVNSSDRQVLSYGRVMRLFLESSRECFRHGSAGLTEDATMLYESWPFDITAVQRPIHFWQGTDDTMVPAVINRTIADRTPGAHWHQVDGGGHFVAVSEAHQILTEAAADFNR